MPNATLMTSFLFQHQRNLREPSQVVPLKIEVAGHARIQKVFFRGGPTLTTFFFLVDEWREEFRYKRDIIGPPVKRYVNGVSLAG